MEIVLPLPHLLLSLLFAVLTEFLAVRNQITISGGGNGSVL